MGWIDEFAFRDCPWCGLRDAHMYVLNTGMSSPRGIDQPRWWAAVACPRCGGAVLLETNAQNESPPTLLKSVPADDHVASQVGFLPDDVAKFYGDARRALDAGIPDAAAVELRKTLEAASAHFEVDEKTLVKSIQALIEKGLVTTQFGEVLDRVRKVGNVGAHASDETVDQATAEQVYRFTTQVLRNLFEIPGELRADEIAALAEDAVEHLRRKAAEASSTPPVE